MKKYFTFLAAAAILFVGFGCSSTDQTKTSNSVSIPDDVVVINDNVVVQQVPVTDTEDKTWRLSFDLPEGWIMTTFNPYKTADGKSLNLGFGNDDYDIYLQNTEKFVLFGGVQPDDYSENLYQKDNIALIKVHFVHGNENVEIPPADVVKSEDLGNGFYKVWSCDLEKSPECAIYGQSVIDYFLTTDSGDKYIFDYYASGVSDDVIEKIILSAKE